MSEHPKKTLERLNKLVSDIPDMSPKESAKSSTESADSVDPVEALKTRKRKPGRPKGSSNGNIGFRKKDQQAMADASKVLWKQKMVTWKLKPEQQCLVDSFKNRTADTLVWVLGRQWGKSFSIGAILIEECLNNPGLRVAYVCPQKAQARSVVEKNFNIILNDCPTDLRPKFDIQGSVWKFPNGSIIRVAGLDGGHIESLRGQTFDIVVVDEAGFPAAADIEYALESVLYPTMTISDKPLLLLVSTPPKTFDHPFNDYWDKAKESGTLIHKTLYDSWLPKAQVYKIEERYGKESISFRREYMAERIADASSLVIPEATPVIMEQISRTYEKPSHCQYYVSADWGVMDNNVILFGYLDWQKQVVVIQDELNLSGTDFDTAGIADAIKAKEQQLWGEMARPMRFCDNNLQLIQDFAILHDLHFLATAKDKKQAAVNQVRVRMKPDHLAIAPHCKTLLNHVQNATWDKKRKKFRQAVGHHYDALDAFIYMVRNIDFQKSPFPANHFLQGDFISPKYNQNKRNDGIGDFASIMFTPKKRRNR